MTRNTIKHGRETKNEAKVPLVISIRTKTHAAHLQNWRRGNLRVPWGALLSDALDEYFAKKGKAA